MKASGPWFEDDQGRRLMLRGVNLGGSSKVPARPDGATHRPESLLANPGASFLDRPFPLDEADEHFRRLRCWGFTFLRFLITWEAIEHLGPGAYDEDYLDYLEAVLERAGEHGFTVLIDPHQDVWSRFTGGDGAPGWTLEAVGFDLDGLAESGACIRHQEWGDPYPWLLWVTNASRLGAATMWTLFLAGDDFAPRTLVAGERVQQYLQRHYIAAVRKVAERTAAMDHVIGFELINEPGRGWIGVEDLRQPLATIKKGPAPTPWESMVLGAGYPAQVASYSTSDRLVGGRLLGRRRRALLNAGRRRAWLPDAECVWRQNGVWEEEGGAPVLRRPDHFAAGRLERDYLLPFARRFIDSIREVDQDALLFLETPPGSQPDLDAGGLDGFVYAPHWYDAVTLVTRNRHPRLAIDADEHRFVRGVAAVERSFDDQLLRHHRFSRDRLGDAPVVFGEVGVPFGLNNGYCYLSGDFRLEEWALDRSMRAVERTLSNAVIWNYTADNTNLRGDQWNGEDFSIFSRDQIASLGPLVQLPVELHRLERSPEHLSAGGRALRAVARPYPRAIAGEPIELRYLMVSRVFVFRFRHDPRISAPTEIYIPSIHYWEGIEVTVTDGEWEYDEDGQLLIWRHDPERDEHAILVKPKFVPQAPFGMRPRPAVRGAPAGRSDATSDAEG